MTRAAIRRAGELLRAHRGLVLLAVASALAVAGLSLFRSPGGLITPEGSVDVGYGVVAVTALGLRGVMIVVFPGLVTYRVVRWAMGRLVSPRPGE